MGNERDPELIAGFAANDPALSREFGERFLMFLHGYIKWRFRKLKHRRDEIESEAVSILVDWRRQGTKLAEFDDIRRLAMKVVSQASINERRRLDRDAEARADIANWPKDDDPGLGGRADAAGALGAIIELVGALPEKYRKAVSAQIAHEMGNGPPVAEALGVVPATARQLWHRGRLLLIERVREAGVALPDWLEARLQAEGGGDG